MSLNSKIEQFKHLHDSERCLLIPNPWDCGTALILQDLGFQALATTSAGLAFSKGMKEESLELEVKLQHCRDLAKVTTVPISADMQKCFAVSPEGVSTVIDQVMETGVAGCSIEDASGDPEKPIFDFQYICLNMLLI